MFAQFRIHPVERRLWKLHDCARPLALAAYTLPQSFMYEMLQIGKNSLASVRNQIVIASPLAGKSAIFDPGIRFPEQGR
jgi:hypothetical protein